MASPITATGMINIYSQSQYQEICGDISIRPYRAKFIDENDTNVMGDFKTLFGKEGWPELCLEVWAGNRSLQNWGSNGIPGSNLRFPSRLPISYFWDKKEGDELIIKDETQKVCFKFKCNGQDTDFSHRLEEMFMIAHNNLPFSNTRLYMEDSEIRKADLIIELKNKHYPNSIITYLGITDPRNDCTIS